MWRSKSCWRIDYAVAKPKAARAWRYRGRVRYPPAARSDWRRTTLARGAATCAPRRVAAAAQNQPWPHATQAGIDAQFTGENAGGGCRYAYAVAIFGRNTARRRLRRATRESLAIPTFSSPVDCTPWVIGGLWPAELATVNAETSTLAEYLNADLRRIASSANDELRMIRRAGMSDAARQAEEARVINEARSRAERRVESTVRQLRAAPAGGRARSPRHAVREAPRRISIRRK